MFENFQQDLSHKTGGDLLAYMLIYYDFDWDEMFGHNRAAFPNCKCLALRVKQECPKGKKPIIILTACDDAPILPIETETHYAVVVKIKDYLANPDYDPSASYFARASQIQLTKSVLLKQIMESPQLVSQIVDSSLTIEKVGEWVTEVPGRLLQLKKLIESNSDSSTEGKSITKLKVDLDNVIDVLHWFTETTEIQLLLDKLSELKAHDLTRITSVLGIANLQNIMKIWENEKQNGSEDFWQETFASNPWAISQVFSYPVVIMTKKAFVGGKAIDNTGGNLVDFLYQNQITTNITIVEIKTPLTKLLSSKYRENAYSISTDLTGSVNQVLNYKEEIQKNYYALSSKTNSKYDAINPKCLLIVGSLQNEQFDDTQRKSFEVFRSELKSVEVITYDELFAKILLLVKLLET